MDTKSDNTSIESRARLARAPYEEIANTAESVGKHWLATSIRKLGERASERTLELAYFDGRIRDKAERDIAFREVCEAHPNLLTLNDFKLSNQDEGPKIWEAVSEKAKTEDEFPVQVIEYYSGEEVMVGDFRSTAEWFTDSRTTNFLHEIADRLEASLEPYTHGLEESIPKSGEL